MRFKDLLPFRNAWLGFALIWIILIHTPFDLGPLNYLRAIGCGGVDICLFASGIGCFYSLSQDSNVVSFMKRRLKRLAPTYMIFIVFWLFYQYTLGNFGFQMAIGNLLAIQNLTGLDNDFNWYISAIFLFYILAPYFKIIAEQASPVRKYLFLVFLLVGSIPFWGADTYIVTITRLPIFYLGMLFADMCKKDKKIKKHHVLGLAVAFVVGTVFAVSTYLFARDYLWSHGLYWYPFILITPPICVAVSWISMLLKRSKLTKPIVDLLSVCGDYSFELYLVHILLFSIIPTVISSYNLSNIRNFVWIAGVICVPIGCFLLRRLSLLFNRLCRRTQKV